MQLWRICKDSYASSAFSGKGSAVVPGRWHNGVRMVYTATSVALASFEVFVNLNEFAEPHNLVCVGATLPSEMKLERVEVKTLGPGWQQNTRLCVALGMEWYESRRTVGLLVPSAAVMGDWNVLLNPEHAEFHKIVIGKPTPFRFDPRMFRHA